MVALMERVPADNGQSFLIGSKVTAPLRWPVERFWKPILISALNEDLDRVSVFYAGQVIRESFMKSAGAGRMGIPAIPLSDLYAAGAGYIQARGGEVFLRTSVECFTVEDGGVRLKAGQGDLVADAVVLAVTSDVAAKLLPEELRPI